MTAKSPTYWEKLRQMDAGELRAAFRTCAEIDLGWAIDQAKCLSYHIESGSAASGILRDFCDRAAGLALKQGAAEAAVTALQIVADVPDAANDTRAQAAVRNLRRALDELAKTNRDQALGTAVLIKAKSWQNPALGGEAVDFMLAHAAPDAGGMLLNIARGGEDLPPAQLGRLVEKTALLGAHKPYEARNVAIEILSGCVNLTNDQRDRLSALTNALSQDPGVLLDILEREYGEDVSQLRALRDAQQLDQAHAAGKTCLPVPCPPTLQ